IRVDEPMLSIVATRRNAESRSGARVPSACHAPLNSSSPAMRFRISGVIWRVPVRIITPNDTPNYTHSLTPGTTPDYAQSKGLRHDPLWMVGPRISPKLRDGDKN